jgi:hypothetical protein
MWRSHPVLTERAAPRRSRTPSPICRASRLQFQLLGGAILAFSANLLLNPSKVDAMMIILLFLSVADLKDYFIKNASSNSGTLTYRSIIGQNLADKSDLGTVRLYGPLNLLLFSANRQPAGRKRHVSVSAAAQTPTSSERVE